MYGVCLSIEQVIAMCERTEPSKKTVKVFDRYTGEESGTEEREIPGKLTLKVGDQTFKVKISDQRWMMDFGPLVEGLTRMTGLEVNQTGGNDEGMFFIGKDIDGFGRFEVLDAIERVDAASDLLMKISGQTAKIHSVLYNDN